MNVGYGMSIFSKRRNNGKQDFNCHSTRKHAKNRFIWDSKFCHVKIVLTLPKTTSHAIYKKHKRKSRKYLGEFFASCTREYL